MKIKNIAHSVAVSLFLFIATNACAEETTSTPTVADAISVENAYVRAVPPVSRTSAAFMTVKNADSNDHLIKEARSDIAEFVELHTHLMGENGMHEMRQVEKVDIPAGGSAELKPGGLHVMLIGLKKPLEAGKTVAITLVYEDGSTTALELPIQNMMQKQMMH